MAINRSGDEPARAPSDDGRIRVALDERQGELARDRRLPLSPELRRLLETVEAETGVTLEVYSGGQRARLPGERRGITVPGERTGSDRHDHGNSADVRAYVMENGQKRYLDWSDPADQKVWSDIVRFSYSGGAKGIGAGVNYMGTKAVHIGYGPEATWAGKNRRTGESYPVPSWLTNAVKAGKLTPPLPLTDDIAKAPIPAPRSMIEDVRAGRPVTSDYVGGGASFDEVRGFGTQLPRQRPIQAPTPMPRPADRMPEPLSALESAKQKLAAARGAVVDSVRSPTLFEQPNGSQVVGIPDALDRRAWDERRVDPKQADFGVGGFGSLLDDRLSPSTPNPTPRTTNMVRPSGPVGGLPPAQPVVNAVRPEGPVGSLPAAPRGTTVTSRPDAPVGRLPAAPRPANAPVGAGAPISLTPFSTLPSRPQTQFGGEGMPSTAARPEAGYTEPDRALTYLIDKHTPSTPQTRPPSLGGTTAAPRLSPPVAKDPAQRQAIAEYVTVMKTVQNPAYTVYLGQLEANQRMTPTGKVVTADQFRALNDPNYKPPAAPKPLTPPPMTIQVPVRVPVAAPALGPVLGPALAPIPAMQSQALLAQRRAAPQTISSNPPINQIRESQTGNNSVGGTTRSMETSTRWTTGY